MTTSPLAACVVCLCVGQQQQISLADLTCHLITTCHSFLFRTARDSVQLAKPNYCQPTGMDASSNSAQNGRVQSEPSVQTKGKANKQANTERRCLKTGRNGAQNGSCYSTKRCEKHYEVETHDKQKNHTHTLPVSCESRETKAS